MNTLGINLTHDASICKCTDGEITFFLEEERLSRYKHDDYPSKVSAQLLDGIDTDEFIERYSNIGITGLLSCNHKSTLEHDTIFETIESFWKSSITKSFRYDSAHQHSFIDNLKENILYPEHHVYHALCGFYNSGFDDAVVIVVDGMGNPTEHVSLTQEVSSAFRITYPGNVESLWSLQTEKYLSDKHQNKINHEIWTCGIGMAYSAISSYMGFGMLGSGKLMGLAPYGKDDPNIKSFLLDDNSVDSSLFYRTKFGCVFIPYGNLPHSVTIEDLSPSCENFQLLANLAYRMQKDFEKNMIFVLKEFIASNISKNIVITGGCALNCVANYEYLNHIPDGFNLYIEPVSSDAGTSIGLAKFLYYQSTNSMEKHPLKSLYLGPEY